MTDKQHRWYLREWSAAFRAHWSGSRKGEAVLRQGRPANPMRDRVVAAAQRLAVTREDGRLSPDLLRRACHLIATGNDVSSWSLRNKQIDQVVAVFRLLAEPVDIAAQMTLDAAEVERARRTLAARAEATGTTTSETPSALPDADRARLLHGLRKIDLPAAYVREIARDKFGTEKWEAMPAEKLLQLMITCKSRAAIRTLANKVRCVPAMNATITDEVSETNRDPTQSSLILARLRETPGEWVPMPELSRVSGAYAVHSRISDLRADGHIIENRITGSRPRRSEFRIVAQRNPTV